MIVGQRDKYQEIKRILWVILFLNWGVSFLKIAYGIFSRCASITADGFHSLSDGASNIIGLIGMRMASQPTDIDHPYGHKKYETFFSLGIAALLFIVAFNLLKEGLRRLYNPILPAIDAKSFAVMVITMAINLAVMIYENRRGRQLQSDFLVSDALHTRADILTSTAVIIALVLIKLGYPIFDPVVTMIIALFITYSAITITKKSSGILCDTVAIVETKKVVDIVLGVKGVLTCHKIRTRGRTDDIHIDLHVQVRPDMHMEEAHKISYQIEGAIKAGIPGVTDVIVHMEPKEKR